MKSLTSCCAPSGIDVNLYPNPIDNELNYQLELKNDMHLTVEVIDLFGKTVYKNELDTTIGNHTFTFDLSELVKGIYIFKLNDGVNQVSKRITKQ